MLKDADEASSHTIKFDHRQALYPKVTASIMNVGPQICRIGAYARLDSTVSVMKRSVKLKGILQ